MICLDLDEASSIPKETKLCTPKLVCPTAANQSFLGCDWKQQKCVCKRGWVLNQKQVCVGKLYISIYSMEGIVK